MLKVYKTCCKNCLLSKDRIVSAKRAKQIIQEVTRKQSYFVCHASSIEDKEIVCKTFFDKLGHVSQMVRIAERLNCVEFVDQPDKEKLIPYDNQKRKL